MKYIEPDFLHKFKCIGDSNCTDSCCRLVNGYSMNDETFERYKTKDNQILDLSNKTYFMGDIRMIKTKEGNCGYLTNGLCDIIGHFGLDFVCSDCKYFPRQLNKINSDIYERSLLLSCPEAVKLLISSKDTMKMIEVEDDSTYGKQVHEYVNSAFNSKLSYKEARETTLNIIQNRDFPLLRRIEMLIEKQHQYDGGNYVSVPWADQNDRQLYINIYKILKSFNEYTGAFHENRRMPFEKILKLIEDIEIHKRSIREHLKNIDLLMGEHDYIFEKVIIASMLTSAIPFNEQSITILRYLKVKYLLFYSVYTLLKATEQYNDSLFMDFIQRYHNNHERMPSTYMWHSEMENLITI